MNFPYEFTYVSTFAGCGGSSLGYKWAGGHGLAAIECDKNAAATYRLNFPDTPLLERDICTVSGAELMRVAGIAVGELDILDGSPPCQGFSTAGNRQVHDSRNSLFEEFVRLVEELQPRVFVMENVSGLIKGKMKWVFRQIMLALKATGYRVRCKLLNTMYFNVPQSRQRLIWIGVRSDIARDPSFPAPQSTPIPLKSICPDAIGSRSMELNAWISPSRAVCTITRTPFRRLLRIPQGTRAPTTEELRIFGSFPADFRFAGNDTQAWNCVGNSVPPRFMQAIAEHIRDAILVGVG